VLAIVAYRQPIGRSGIEHMRGSASDSAIATLLDRGSARFAGRQTAPLAG
jgi:chromosome segregation and condensation protein ScpB